MVEPRLTLQDVKRLSPLSDDTIHREIRRGRLPGRKVCGRWLFRESAVLQWLNPEIKNAPACGGDRSRATGGLAGAEISTPATAGGLQ